MIKPIKIMLGGIVALILILLIMLYVLLFIVDINDFKQQINTLTKNTWGRELSLPGKIKLSFFPTLTLSTGAIKLGNPTDFQGYFITANAINLRLKTSALLSQKIDADYVQIDGLQVSLLTNQHGRHNWDHGWGVPATNEAPSRLLTFLANASLKGIQLTNATVDWQNLQNGQHITVNNLNVTTSTLALHTPVTSAFSFTVTDHSSHAVATVTGKNTVAVNDNLDQLTLTETQLHSTVTGKFIAAKSIHLHLDSKNITIDLAHKTAKTDALQLKLADAVLNSSLITQWSTQPPTFNGHLHLLPTSFSKLMAQLALPLPPSRSEKAWQRLEGECAFQTRNQAVELNDVSITLDDTTAQGTLKITGAKYNQIYFDIHVDTLDADRYLQPESTTTQPTDPATLLAFMPIETLRKLTLSGKVTVGDFYSHGSHLHNTELVLNN